MEEKGRKEEERGVVPHPKHKSGCATAFNIPRPSYLGFITLYLTRSLPYTCSAADCDSDAWMESINGTL